MAFGHIYCEGAKPTAGTSIIFVVDKNGSATSATCIVGTGNTTGTLTVSLSFAAGDIIDVKVVNGNAPGGVSWSLGP